MPDTSRASLGYVTSYGAARRGGYQGTYEEWCALMAEVADHLEQNQSLYADTLTAKGAAEDAQTAAETAQGKAEDAQEAAETAQGKAEDAQEAAEAWAVGTSGGEPGATNNAAYYAGQAGSSAEAAAGSASDAEAFGAGTRGGDDVTSGDEAYHNNAKYHADQASTSATAAAASAASAAEAALTGNLAPVYSSSATYAVGDMVLYNGTLYECSTAITTAEAWTAAHWTAKKLAPEVADLKTQLGTLSNLNTDNKSSTVAAINEVNGHFLDGIEEGVAAWLDEHPEATTTVEDRSLTYEKLVTGTLGFVTPEMFGAKGDGVTDDTTALQESLDSGFNVQLTSGAVYLVDYLNLNSADGITIFGNGLLKRIDSGSSYSILTVNNCDNITIEELNTDGNIANNGVTVNENKQSLTVKNSTNIFIGTLNDHNPAGDTLYVSNVKKLSINNLISVSDSYTGRNALSIISGEDIYVNNLISVKTGYYTMPSGIDLEPNNSSESIKRVFINNAYIDSDGTYGFSISNVSAKADISDITIAKCYITKAEKISNRHNSCVILTYANRVKGSFVCRQTGTNVAQLDDGLNFGNVTDSDIYLDCDNAQRGIVNNGKLKNITVKAIITNSYQNAMQVNNGDESTNVVFDVAIGDFGLSGSGAGFMVSSGSTASGIALSGDLSKKTYGSQCLRFEGAIINIVADGLDMTGWTASNKVYGAQAASGGFVGRNCKNYNYLSAIPTGYDGYTKGTIIMNTNPTAGGYVGWVCVESGKTGTWKGFGEIAS